jgi:hypothetical protein
MKRKKILLELHKIVRDPKRVARRQRHWMWLWLVMGAFFLFLAVQFHSSKYSSNEVIPAYLAGLYAGLALFHWSASSQAEIFSRCLDQKKVEVELGEIGEPIPK